MAIDRIAQNITQRTFRMPTQTLRDLVNKGFTIENRRSLQGLIGQDEMQKLGDAFVDLSEKKNYLFFTNPKLGINGKVATFKLNVGNGQYELTYLSDFTGINSRKEKHTLVNNQISLENIINTLKEYKAKYFDSRINGKALPKEALEESKTIKMLYSHKYKVPQGLNEDGYYITSIVDNTTKEPVTAYVKQIEICHIYEKWGIFVKDSEGNYKMIGSRSVQVKESGNVEPCGYMKSMEQEKYSGVGLRLHQIAIERMLQSKGKSISLISTDKSFPFHYKCGYRVNPENDKILSYKEYVDVLNEYGTILGIRRETLENSLIKRDFNGVEGYGEEETYQELAKLLFLENKGRVGLNYILMELPPEALEAWNARIKAQPILQASY